MRQTAHFRRTPLCPAIALALSTASEAAILSVDGKNCTLVDAITAANTDTATGGCRTGRGADTLDLQSRVYTLKTVNNSTSGPNGLPSVVSNITFNGDPDGDGRGALIQRSSQAGTPEFRLLHVAAGGKLTMNRVSLSNRWTPVQTDPDVGGAIFNEKKGSVALNQSTVSGNGAYSSGGGIFNNGNLTLTHSTLSGNLTFAHSGGGGSGLSNAGNAIVHHCNFVNNATPYGIGGGISNAGSLTLINSTVSGNHGYLRGGGISNSGNLTLTNGTISRNTGGGITTGGKLTLTNSTVSGNIHDGTGNGGGLSIYGRSTSTSISNSSVSGNYAGYAGGGIFINGGNLTLTHSTLSGNTAVKGGGGIDSETGSSAHVTLINSLIAQSSGGGDCVGTNVDLQGVNLIGDGSCNPQLSGDPKLGSLVDNGGAALTHPLLAGSPALDAADRVLCKKTDQRGVKRPQGKRCDIGAFERVVDAAPEVQPMLALFDSPGGLVGTGDTPATQFNQREAARHQLLAAGDFIERGLKSRACGQLRATRSRIDTDGTPDENDYVTGPDAEKLATEIKTLRTQLGCG